MADLLATRDDRSAGADLAMTACSSASPPWAAAGSAGPPSCLRSEARAPARRRWSRRVRSLAVAVLSRPASTLPASPMRRTSQSPRSSRPLAHLRVDPIHAQVLSEHIGGVVVTVSNHRRQAMPKWAGNDAVEPSTALSNALSADMRMHSLMLLAACSGAPPPRTSTTASKPGRRRGDGVCLPRPEADLAVPTVRSAGPRRQASDP